MKKTLALLALAATMSLPLMAADKAKAAAKPAEKSAASSDAKNYPAVTGAIKATENAIATLGKVKADLGAHQAAAEKALNTALTELKAGLEEAKAAKAKK
jgi:flagellin-like hook-associated protein FlgL